MREMVKPRKHLTDEHNIKLWWETNLTNLFIFYFIFLATNFFFAPIFGGPLDNNIK